MSELKPSYLCVLLLLGGLACPQLVRAQVVSESSESPNYYYESFESPVFQAQPPVQPPPAPPPPAPPPPPPVVQVPPPIPPFSPPIIVPTDVSRLQTVDTKPVVIPPNLAPVSEGVVVLSDKKFPGEDKSGPQDKIIAFAKDGAEMERTSPYSVKLVSGTIFVSVRKPSQLGLVKTPLGAIALSSNGELMIKMLNGKLHILNASAMGTKCKIRLDDKTFASYTKKTVAIRPGYEFVASESVLSKNDLRPQDGIARRRSKAFEDGRIALSEFSVDAFVRYSDLVAHLNQENSSAKERRIIADLSKMAAVLNQVNGSQGYSYTNNAPNTKLAGADKPLQ